MRHCSSGSIKWNFVIENPYIFDALIRRQVWSNPQNSLTKAGIERSTDCCSLTHTAWHGEIRTVLWRRVLLEGKSIGVMVRASVTCWSFELTRRLHIFLLTMELSEGLSPPTYLALARFLLLKHFWIIKGPDSPPYPYHDRHYYFCRMDLTQNWVRNRNTSSYWLWPDLYCYPYCGWRNPDQPLLTGLLSSLYWSVYSLAEYRP